MVSAYSMEVDSASGGLRGVRRRERGTPNAATFGTRLPHLADLGDSIFRV